MSYSSVMLYSLQLKKALLSILKYSTLKPTGGLKHFNQRKWHPIFNGDWRIKNALILLISVKLTCFLSI